MSECGCKMVIKLTTEPPIHLQTAPENTVRIPMEFVFAKNPEWDEIKNKPAVFPPEAHRHGWNQIDDKPATFPPEAHNHDGRYYTETEIDGKLTVERQWVQQQGYLTVGTLPVWHGGVSVVD